MMLKNLMVHLDQGSRSAIRLEIAVSLAKNNGARLVGVFAQRANYRGSGLISTWPSDEHLNAGKVSKKEFEMATQGLVAQWVDINSGDDSEVLTLICEKARYFDLVIMGQHDEAATTFIPAELVEEVLSNSGRPALVIPYIGNFSCIFKRPLIAWNGSREAAHALNDALPLMNHCEKAIVLSFDSSLERAEKSCKEISTHLSCHGISSKAEVMLIENIGVMDMLLNNACDQGADLLVMGAHSHFGFPFISRGAGTRHILKTMVLPILMSN